MKHGPFINAECADALECQKCGLMFRFVDRFRHPDVDGSEGVRAGEPYHQTGAKPAPPATPPHPEPRDSDGRPASAWLSVVTDDQLAGEWRRRHGMPIGALGDRTEAELCAERERRGLISGNLAVVDLVRASDQALREECRARGMTTAKRIRVGDGPRLGVLEDVVALAAERDALHAEVCRLTEHAHGPAGPDGCERCRFERERDEWKRRAEAAEGDLKVALLNNFELGLTLAAGVERIDPRPDNSVAWLDEDLLADDA